MMRPQRLGEAASYSASGLINQANALAVKSIDARQEAKPAQLSVRAHRKIESGRIGAVDDIEIVIAGQHQNALRKPRIGRNGLQQLRPFRRASSICYVAGDENGVERIIRMDDIQQLKHSVQSPVSARAGSAAFDSKTVALAYDMNIRQVSDAPRAARDRVCWKRAEIKRLRHRRISEGPDQCSDREIGAHQHDTVGYGDGSQVVRRSEVDKIAQPARARPENQYYHRCNATDNDTRRCCDDRPQHGKLRFAKSRSQDLLGEMP